MLTQMEVVSRLKTKPRNTSVDPLLADRNTVKFWVFFQLPVYESDGEGGDPPVVRGDGERRRGPLRPRPHREVHGQVRAQRSQVSHITQIIFA